MYVAACPKHLSRSQLRMPPREVTTQVVPGIELKSELFQKSPEISLFVTGSFRPVRRVLEENQDILIGMKKPPCSLKKAIFAPFDINFNEVRRLDALMFSKSI